jgi:hypothetical protein
MYRASKYVQIRTAGCRFVTLQRLGESVMRPIFVDFEEMALKLELDK